MRHAAMLTSIQIPMTDAKSTQTPRHATALMMNSNRVPGIYWYALQPGLDACGLRTDLRSLGRGMMGNNVSRYCMITSKAHYLRNEIEPTTTGTTS